MAMLRIMIIWYSCFSLSHRGVFLGIQGVQNLTEISYGFQDKQDFPIPPKFKMAAKNRKSLNFSQVLEEQYLLPSHSF